MLALGTWCMMLDWRHSEEERTGRLWVAFGVAANNRWAQSLRGNIGYALFVVPALVIQWIADTLAFVYGQGAFSIGLSIGLKLFDATNSHLALASEPGAPAVPGKPTAYWFLATAGFIAIVCRDVLAADSRAAMTGFLLGALPFVFVIPLLKFFGERGLIDMLDNRN